MKEVRVIGPLARELEIQEFYNQCHDERGRFCEGEDGPGRVRDRVVGRRGGLEKGDASLKGPPTDFERTQLPEWLSKKQIQQWEKYTTSEHRSNYVEQLKRGRELGTTPPKMSAPSKAPIGGPNGPQRDDQGWMPYGTKRALIGSETKYRGAISHLRERLLESGITENILSEEKVLNTIRTERPLEVRYANSAKKDQHPVWIYRFSELDDVKIGFAIDAFNGGIVTAYPTEMERSELNDYLKELYGGK